MFESLAKKPKDWADHWVPENLINEWLAMPGLEKKIKDEKMRHGLDEHGDVVIIAGKPEGGVQQVWLHPIAAHEFGVWYAGKISRESRPTPYGLLYAAFYDNGLAKVGMTASHAETRISNHDATMAITNAARVESFSIPTKTPAKRVEKMLLRMMHAKHESRSAEWFVGADPGDVRTMMEDCIEEDLHGWCWSARINN